MKRKIIALLLSAVFVLSIAGCAKPQPQQPEPEIQAQVQTMWDEEETPDAVVSDTASETQENSPIQPTESATAQSKADEQSEASAQSKPTQPEQSAASQSQTASKATSKTQIPDFMMPNGGKEVEKSGNGGGSTDSNTLSVTISINCDNAVNGGYTVPCEADILSGMQVSVKKGATVYDVLKEVTRAEKIVLATNGSGSSVYVQGIAGLLEKKCGAQSGWLYSVNGEFSGKSCGSYKLEDGDDIAWHYTLDMGADLGANVD